MADFCARCGGCCYDIGVDVRPGSPWRNWLKDVLAAPDPDTDEGWVAWELAGESGSWTPDTARRARADARFILSHWYTTYGRTTCVAYDEATRSCTAYEDRPPVCRDFPHYGRDTVDDDRLPEACSYRSDWQPVVLK